MKKSIILITLIVTVLAYVWDNMLVFKVYDVTQSTNILNKDLPYVKYDFKDVRVYKGIFNNNYLLWEAYGATENADTKEFAIRDAFNLKGNNHVGFRDFDKSIRIFWYLFSFFNRPHFIDTHRLVYTNWNKITIWLWNIEDFLASYLNNGDSQIRQPHDDIMQNLSYIPHIEIYE